MFTCGESAGGERGDLGIDFLPGLEVGGGFQAVAQADRTSDGEDENAFGVDADVGDLWRGIGIDGESDGIAFDGAGVVVNAGDDGAAGIVGGDVIELCETHAAVQCDSFD